MNNYESIKRVMSDIFGMTEEIDGVRMTTQYLYPSSSFVSILVRGGENTFFMSDEGRGVFEIEAAGVNVLRPDKTLYHLVAPHGLQIKDGVIRSPHCTLEEVPLAIALVANVSMQVADWLFSHTKIKKHRNFKVMVQKYLRHRYLDYVRPETITGRSNKTHKFDNIIILGEGRRLSVDPVVHDPASINARVVANMDVKNANYPDLDQRIIYDDEEDWSAAELNLLQVGAPVIAFSRANEALLRYGAIA